MLYRLSYGSAGGPGAACRRRSIAISAGPSQALRVTGVAKPDEDTDGAAERPRRTVPDRAAERAERLARALRLNLRKRKEQARARRTGEGEPPATPGRPTGDG
ncbi:MAG: hypothetical protein KatS3mg117_1352 [Geminicoccaceae bacterium]|nr:MAG: hypothetical protein KatS3mg117_1352 [Geminicoccaceae bacterium]